MTENYIGRTNLDSVEHGPEDAAMRVRIGVLIGVLIGMWLVTVIPAARSAEVAAVDAAAPKAPLPAIAGSRAGDYVGQEVIVEGRVAAIHESPLATVVAFSPNFAGFTATILAADRDKFPSDLEARIRDRTVRVSGTVTTYRGKPEMALRDPAQLTLAPPPGLGSVVAPPAAPAAPPDRAAEEMRRALARIEARLEAIEGRLTTIEQAPPEPEDAAPAR